MLFRNAFHALLRRPGFALAAIVSLTLGTGLAVGFSSLADAVLFRPLPVPEPDRLLRIFSASKLHPLGFVSYPDYQDFVQHAKSFSGIVAQTQVLLALQTPGRKEPRRVRLGLAVSPNYFEVLGVKPVIGRVFAPDERHSAGVVLSHACWESQFGGKYELLGTTVEFAGRPFTVIGVMPEDFGLDRFLHEDFYVSADAYNAGLLPGGEPMKDRSRRYFTVYARLKPRVSPAQAQAEMDALSGQLAENYPDSNRNQRAVVLTGSAARRAWSPLMNSLAWALVSGATLGVVIASLNVAGLMLLRAETRRGEFALRAAVGEPSWRGLARLSVEGGILAVTGAALGWGIARTGIHWIAASAVLPLDVRAAVDARFDVRIATVSLGSACLLTTICGVVPWVALRRISPASVLKTAGVRASSRSFWSGIPLACQVAVATALTGLSASLFAGIHSARKLDLGYRVERILTMALDPAQVGMNETQTRHLYRNLAARISTLHGVEQAALAQTVPLGIAGAQRKVTIPAHAEPLSIWVNSVTPGYLELMQMPVAAGRTFTSQDVQEASSVAVINQELARYWPDGALGKVIDMNGRKTQVIGVVKTAKYFELGERPLPFLYLPYEQSFASRMVLHVKISAGTVAKTVAPSIFAAIREAEPSLPVSEIRELEQYLEQGALFSHKIASRLTMTSGGCALLFALVGLSSSVAAAMRRRRRELAIRQALGATPLRLLLEGAGATSFWCVFAIASGAGLSHLVQRSMSVLIPGNGKAGITPTVFAILAVLAAVIPAILFSARRSLRLLPAVAIRHE
jgi:putative ABC transport system permease protein